MQLQIFKNRTFFTCSMWQKLKMRQLYWTLMGIVLLQQINTINGVKFKGDTCITKGSGGICREWGECPIIKTLIESGQYTGREVVSCGFVVREELICCPIMSNEPTEDTDTSDNTDRFVIKSTTEAPVRDFWLDLLENVTTTTTRPFWADLLSSTSTTTTTTTTTTTLRPLIVGDKQLNESSEYYDLSALLSGKQNGARKREQEISNNNANNAANSGFVNNNNKQHGNLNTGPVNFNQWNFDTLPNQQNSNGRGNNGFRGNMNGNIGRGQLNQPQNFLRGQQNNNRGQNNIIFQQNNGQGNNGRGQGNNGRGQGNNGRGQGNNSRVQGNNGRGRNGNSNSNGGFIFPDSDMRPNTFQHENLQILPPGGSINTFPQQNTQNFRPGGPVNIMVDQNPNTAEKEQIQELVKNVFDTSGNANENRPNPFNNNNPERVQGPINTFQQQNTQNVIPGGPVNIVVDQNPTTAENEHLQELIKNVFDTSGNANENRPNPAKAQEAKIDDVIANIFNVNQNQNSANNPSNSKPQVEFFPPPQQQQHVEFINPQTSGHFHAIPVIDQQFTTNTIDSTPSTSFIQQPVVVETWSNNPVPTNEFNPIQIVYENLVNSGMDIVKAKAEHVENIFNQQQQQFGQQQHVMVVPQTSFSQPPQFIYQPPFNGQQIGQHTSEKLVEQSESSGKEPRSTSPIQQFVEQPSGGTGFNVQSPPTQILDPFKPFEFRPPPEDENLLFVENNSLLSPNPTTKSTTTNERPAVRACQRIEKGLTASLSPHILGGTPAELGEFPHMVGIGYTRVGGEGSSPYDIRCGGTLIDKRFVLTAAHCVADPQSLPAIVRMGVVNFTDPEQMSAAVEMRIKQTYIHDDYSTRLTYNDIAIMELERDVEYSEYIYPVCLYTDEKDPDTSIKLWVTGWGTVNTTTRSFSNILLKAPLYTSPLESCNKSFTDYGLTRKIPEGVIRTQFCAGDKGQIRDACQGDSGGPLNLIVDESYKKYRLVGIVSSGFGCASSTPGLYTRVAAFLDFIEKIVWPNGGD